MSEPEHSPLPKPQPALKPGQFFGDLKNRLNTCGLILAEVRHDYARNLPQHHHELAFFNLLLDGNYCETYGRKTVTLKPFTIIFQPPGIVHRNEIGRTGIGVFSIELEPQWLDRLAEYVKLPETYSDTQGGELVWLATRMYRQYREFGYCTPLAIEGLMLEMLAVTARLETATERRPPLWLSRVIERLHAEFHQNLTVTEIATEAGIHPIHLSRVFRQFHHQTIGEYLHRLRISFACRQLANGAMGLTELALASGFADQSHFTRVFKQITGLTPGAFRATLIFDSSDV
jgi:AraC family transcriptional regulator